MGPFFMSATTITVTLLFGFAPTTPAQIRLYRTDATWRAGGLFVTDNVAPSRGQPAFIRLSAGSKNWMVAALSKLRPSWAICIL